MVILSCKRKALAMTGAGVESGEAWVFAEGAGVGGLVSSAAGKEPAGGGVGGGVQMGPFVGQLEQEACEGLGDWHGRVSKSHVEFAVERDEVVERAANDPCDRLSEEEHEPGRDPDGKGRPLVAERTSEKFQAAALRQGRSLSSAF
ncbi:hypothetical protein AB0C33_14670 [Nonomuraea sp. NPDC048881]|uniref:hypothetical protein n=1 Tax=Nonomuraea sp. NPDC048881 TaxID=3155030 RepID=UPI0033C7C739